nr:MAG TPA: hypothetical protein [Caudoviricetes sp.]
MLLQPAVDIHGFVRSIPLAFSLWILVNTC